MIDYSILHHVPGRIRIAVPLIKKLSVKELEERFSGIKIPDGIKHVRPNPITGTVIINYNPKTVDITQYLLSMATGSGFYETDVKGGCDE